MLEANRLRLVIAVSMLSTIYVLVGLVGDDTDLLKRLEKIYAQLHAFVESREPYDEAQVLRDLADIIDRLRERGVL